MRWISCHISKLEKKNPQYSKAWNLIKGFTRLKQIFHWEFQICHCSPGLFSSVRFSLPAITPSRNKRANQLWDVLLNVHACHRPCLWIAGQHREPTQSGKFNMIGLYFSREQTTGYKQMPRVQFRSFVFPGVLSQGCKTTQWLCKLATAWANLYKVGVIN